uniref:HrSH2 protein n=1 Tax=Halocynthia roretzi TaxID=7729 RepID=O44235_HALRO|nr:HrSH2 [Halocynthia roretzi]
MYEELTPGRGSFTAQNKIPEEVDAAPSQDVLRKELENELRSDKSDIRSYAWFHGRMPRDIAEDLIRREGDFLIRESVNNAGEFVLTCKYKSATYHFKINKKTMPKVSSVFDSAILVWRMTISIPFPLSVYYHVGKKIPVSKKSGVILSQPVNRDIPISYSEVKYASLKRTHKNKTPTKHWNNNNNNSPTGREASSSPHLSTSLSSSPSSSASSLEYHDRNGHYFGPRTPSPQQPPHSIYSTPRSPATQINHHRKTSDPLPHVPPKSSVTEAVVLDVVEVVPNSYTPIKTQSGKRHNSPGAIGNPSPNRYGNQSPVHQFHQQHLTPPPSSPSYSNGSGKPNPFPLTLFEDPNKDGSPQVCIVPPSVNNRPVSQVDMNVESHGKFVSRAGSDPLLSPSRRDGMELSSPKPHNTNSNNNSNAFTFQPSPHQTATELKSNPIATKIKTVPPKPSRVPSFRAPVIKGSLQQSAGNNSLSNRMGSVKNSVALLGDKRRTPPTIAEVQNTGNVPASSVSLRSKPPSSSKTQRLAQKKKRASCFKPTQYQCTLLSFENPPLEGNALKDMRRLLLSVDPFKLARHMTVIDCKVCRIMEGELENALLPHGHQLRQDIIERYQCIAFWVAICVIKCTNHGRERVDMLNTFIQVANELVHSMGNVFGFSAIMHGLTCPQVSSLDISWESLHRKYTNNAVTYDKKLRPLLRYLDEGKGQIRHSSVCIPHIMPFTRLLENPGPGIPHASTGETAAKRAASFGSLLDRTISSLGNEDTASLNSTGRDVVKADWWENRPNESFDSLLGHMNSGRLLIQHLDDFKKNANSKLVDFKEYPKVREMFTTDFQMRLLFGYRGAESLRFDRYQKFDKIITAMLRHMVE